MKGDWGGERAGSVAWMAAVMHFSGLRSETSLDHARVLFYLCSCPMNDKDRMTP